MCEFLGNPVILVGYVCDFLMGKTGREILGSLFKIGDSKNGQPSQKTEWLNPSDDLESRKEPPGGCLWMLPYESIEAELSLKDLPKLRAPRGSLMDSDHAGYIPQTPFETINIQHSTIIFQLYPHHDSLISGYSADCFKSHSNYG